MKDTNKDNCKVIDHSGSGFKFRYNATYLRLLAGNEFLVIGGSDKLNGTPVTDVQHVAIL